MSNPSFGIELYLKLLSQEPGKNIFVSPLSVSMAVCMALNGADSSAAQSIKDALRLSDMELDEINSMNEALISTLCSEEEERETPEDDLLAHGGDFKLVINVANSLWARKGLIFKDEFVKICEKQYSAVTDYLDPEDPNAPDKINEWVSNKTKGKITKIIDHLGQSFVLILVNAVYFKAPWTLEFSEGLTEMRPFYLSDGATKDHPLMFNTETFAYQKSESFQAIRLPYAEGRYSMTVILPDKESSLEELHSKFTVDMWKKITLSFKPKYGQVGLPRFKADWGETINEALADMGMADAFSEKADFSRMIEGDDLVWLNQVLHKTYVKVWEKGTEAAAVTAMIEIGEVEDDPVEEFCMIIDRPFIYIIDDWKTGSILFIGSMQNPEDVSDNKQ